MTQSEFIRELARLVQKYAPQYGILVCSPIIAQGILESGRGTSELAVKANNYHGLKYKPGRCPTASGVYHKVGSEQNADGTYTSSAMQWFKFDSMEDAVIGYFDFINNARYANLKGQTDPYQYLVDIRADGYATSLKYVENVYRVVQEYNLTQYDTIIKVEGGNSMDKKRVCIDAGHFKNYNKCPAIPEYSEAKTVWKLHLLQKKYLGQLGIEVAVTREDQEIDLALDKRGKVSEGYDLLISNHTNAVGGGMNESIDYAAVYHLVDDATTKADDISKEIAKLIAPVIANVMGTKGGYKVLTRKSGNDRNKDGVLNDNYYGVLNGARMVGTPALIIEHSFHTNTRAVRWLMDDNNLDKLARAEAECIASHLLGKTVKLGNTTSNKVESPVEDKTDKLYRVQIGAYTKLSNAQAQLKAIEALGIDAFIVLYGSYYRVQVGAYSKKSGAENMLAMVKNKGLSAIITTTSTALGTDEFNPYRVKITASSLNVRSGAGTDHRIVTSIKKGGIYTIVEESNGWGKLKSGAGWISLKHTAKLA